MEKFSKDRWKRAVRHARLGQTEPMLVRFSAEPVQSDRLGYGHIKESRREISGAGIHKAYAEAIVLVRLPLGGPMEVLCCPPELLEEVRSVETWIGTYESVRYIESPQYGFEGNKWLQQVRYAQDEARATGHEVLVRFNMNEAPFLQYGRCAVKELGLCDLDVQEAYHKAAVLVRITPSMECEIIRNNVGVMDSVIRCGLPSRAEQPAIDLHNRMKQLLDVAAEKGLTMPTPSSAKELKAAPKATPMPPKVELWWQKEQREAAEKLDEVVALRNDVRSLLGM